MENVVPGEAGPERRPKVASRMGWGLGGGKLLGKSSFTPSPLRGLGVKPMYEGGLYRVKGHGLRRGRIIPECRDYLEVESVGKPRPSPYKDAAPSPFVPPPHRPPQSPPNGGNGGQAGEGIFLLFPSPVNGELVESITGEGRERGILEVN